MEKDEKITVDRARLEQGIEAIDDGIAAIESVAAHLGVDLRPGLAPEQRKRAALLLLHDPILHAVVALTDTDYSVRHHAVARVESQDVCVWIADTDPMPCVRDAASERLQFLRMSLS